MTKVEQVARAIATAEWKVNGDERFNANDAYDLTNNNGRFAFDEMARAALSAMREITPQMANAVAMNVNAASVMDALVNAALSETSEES